MQSGFNDDWLSKQLTNEHQVIEKYPSFSTRTLVNLTNLLYNKNVDLTLEEVRDCFSKSQLASKLWLVHELNNLGLWLPQNILIVGGWIGSLAAILFEHSNFEIRQITSVDLDPCCELPANLLNYEEYTNNNKFRAFTADMHRLNYEDLSFLSRYGDESYSRKYDILINTSCEHISDIGGWAAVIPKGKIVIAQSNNFFEHDDHISCVRSAQELENQLNLHKVLFSGSLKCHSYDRFMVIAET